MGRHLWFSVQLDGCHKRIHSSGRTHLLGNDRADNPARIVREGVGLVDGVGDAVVPGWSLEQV